MPRKKSDISKRKQSDTRRRTKETLEGLRTGWDSIIRKAKAGETLRDEDLRYLRNVADTITDLEARVAESLKEEESLPEGRLKEYIERLWKLKEIGRLEDVIEATGYYICEECGFLHLKGRPCMYHEYQEIKNKEENL